MQAVILAGGKGTRLRPFTLQQPKPLLPLLEIPFLFWMVERCCRAGLQDILISVGYLGQQVEAVLGDGSPWGVSIRYIHETAPLDTAGALTLARPLFTGAPLVVFNADILTDLDLSALIEVHRTYRARATLTLTRVSNITAYGLVETTSEGRIKSFREKPSPEEAQHITTDTINAGTYVLDPEIFTPYPAGEPLSFERRVFPDLLQAGHPMMAYIHPGYWRDLGTPGSYYEGQLDILQGKMADFPVSEVAEIRPGVWVHPTAEVHETCHLEAPCYIGAHGKIGAAAMIPGGTIVGHHSWIGARLSPGVYAPGTLVV